MIWNCHWFSSTDEKQNNFQVSGCDWGYMYVFVCVFGRKGVRYTIIVQQDWMFLCHESITSATTKWEANN